MNTAILLDRYIKAYEKACDTIAKIDKDIEELKNQMIDTDDIKEVVTPLIDDSLTILPIERLADFGGSAERNSSGVIDLKVNASMQNPTNYLFKTVVDSEYKGLKLSFVNSDGTKRLLVMNSSGYNSLLYNITNDTKKKCIIIYEHNFGKSYEIFYDSDGNFLSKETTTNVTDHNILTELNSKAASGSYSPTAATDVATKEYVDSNRGSSVHYVDVTMTVLDPDIIVESDTDFEQIEALINAGESVVCRLIMPKQFIGVEIIMYSSSYSVAPKQSVDFTVVVPISGAPTFMRVTFSPDGISCKELS